jgi:putative transposase
LYPNKQQTEKLELCLETCRQTYNQLLSKLSEGFTKNEIQNYILDLKICYPDMQQVHSKVLQMENQKLFANLSGLGNSKKNGNKVGRLRYKGKGWKKTFTYNQSGFKIIGNKKLYLSKVGDVKCKIHREVEGKIKQVEIKREVDKWFALISTDIEYKKQKGDKFLGIDLGINHYIVDSEDNKIEHPKSFEKMLKQIQHSHKQVSRKKKGSKNRLRARKQLQKKYQKLQNKRTDFLHKLSTKYISQCNIIAIEDLNIQSMMKSSYNAKNIADSSWYRFRQLLSIKAESAGCKIVPINPAYTTQECNSCGNKQPMEIWKRTYCCEKCNKEFDRDYNSAIVIKQRAKEILGKELTCLEKQPLLPNKKQVASMNYEAPSFM